MVIVVLLICVMTLRIERLTARAGSVLRLIGQVGAEHLEELRTQLGSSGERVSFDLEEVTLIDTDAIRFFVDAEEQGIEVSNPSPYIREWMKRIRESQR